MAVNPSGVLGGYDYRITPTTRYVRDLLDSTAQTGLGGFGYVDVRDVARAHVRALARGDPGARHIVSSVNTTMKAFGETWVKHDDPATADDAVAASDPVFGKGESGTWDRVGAYQPRVRRTPDGWVMLYRGLAGADQTGRLGIALSADGVAWERHPANPVLSADAVAGGRAIWFAELEYLAGSYYLFFELGSGNRTEIYLATFDGSLAP